MSVPETIDFAPVALFCYNRPRHLQKTVEAEAEILDRQGALPKAPASLGGKSLTELLAEGSVKVKVDPKYPQALGISTITHRASVFGNSHWEILLNEGVTAFFTSCIAGDEPPCFLPGSIPKSFLIGFEI